MNNKKGTRNVGLAVAIFLCIIITSERTGLKATIESVFGRQMFVENLR